MSPRRELIARPECGPRWDCRGVSPTSGMGIPRCVPSPTWQLLPASGWGWHVWECPENMSCVAWVGFSGVKSPWAGI